ncbi:MAG TPA: aminotransferase class IV [Gemmatimonadales bacterium]|nr:aminotransferase class IV [Gemmatimonadales bacterium]
MTRVGNGTGLIETMRARDGRIPWLDRHLARLRTSLGALDLAAPRDDLAALVRAIAGARDCVIRLEVHAGTADLTTRAVAADRSRAVVVSSETHAPYPYKTTAREQFGRAFAEARRTGADDALLVTRAGHVAEGTAWNLFWWESNGRAGGAGGAGQLSTPAADLGILPGIGRARVMELTDAQEVRVPVSALVGCSLFLVNAVRGIEEIGIFQGHAVPRDARTAELSSRFWPD